MSARPDIHQDGDTDRFDVLTWDEESALCAVREVVGAIRGRGAVADIESVARSMIDAGASHAGDGALADFRMFRFRGAVFSLAIDPHPGGGIEVNFDPRRE
jgi:hypothetical protein